MAKVNKNDTAEPYEDISKFLQISMTTEQQTLDEQPVVQDEIDSHLIGGIQNDKSFESNQEVVGPSVIENDANTETNDFTSNEDIDDIVLQPDGKSLCLDCGLEFPNLIIGKDHYLSVHHVKSTLGLEKNSQISSTDDQAQLLVVVKDENMEEEKFANDLVDSNSISWQDTENDKILLQPDGKALCQLCVKILSNMAIGKRHFSRKHQQNVPHSCQICNKIFKNKIKILNFKKNRIEIYSLD
jgi:hypothetical protein